MIRTWSLLLLSLSSLTACGNGIGAPPSYDWDRGATTTIASLNEDGGMVPQMMRFASSLYGDDYVMLAGDGKLYFGTPSQASVRQLDEQEMQLLLARIRPDLFQRYEPHYDLVQATDLPITWLSVQVKGYPSSSVSIYGLDFSGEGEPQAQLPVDLTTAVRALREAAAGGAVLHPTRLLVGAATAQPAELAAVDTSKAAEWPLPEIDLAKLSLEKSGAATLTGAQVEAVLPLLQSSSSWQGTLLRQGSDYFWVGYSVVLF